MAVFWILAVAMTAVALAFVLVPLLRARPAAAPTEAEANLEVLRSQRREIEADIAAGTLPAESRDEALAELVGRAAEDLSDAPAAAPPAGERRAWIPATVVAVTVPALAFGLYVLLGTPLAADPKVMAAASGSLNEQQILAMVDSLAAKVKDRPDDVQGWALLARSMAAIGRFREASDAYAHLRTLVPPDADLLADHADVLAMAQGQRLAGQPAEWVRQALAIDPKHEKALALAAMASLEAGDAPRAIAYWETLASILPPGSPDAREVERTITEVRAQMGPRDPLGLQPPKMFEKQDGTATQVSGTVSISPGMRERLTGSETIFVFARAANGPRAPLAVLRASARDLPMRFTLDDSQAMAPGMTISSADTLYVEARVSRSGNAAPQPGDLAGRSEAVKPGARDVTVLVDQVLP